jgi:hypothetical protein
MGESRRFSVKDREASYMKAVVRSEMKCDPTVVDILRMIFPNSRKGCKRRQFSFHSGTSQTAKVAVRWIWTDAAGYITLLLFARRQDWQCCVTSYWGEFMLLLGDSQFSEAHDKWRYCVDMGKLHRLWDLLQIWYSVEVTHGPIISSWVKEWRNLAKLLGKSKDKYKFCYS